MRRVVVGVHDSPASRQALRWAVDAARRMNATLEIVTAVPYDGGAGAGEAVLVGERLVVTTAMREAQHRIVDDTLGDAASLPPVVQRIVRGPAMEALTARSIGAELLVVGVRGRSGSNELSAAPTARQCALTSQCPVILVRAGRASDADTAARTVPPAAHGDIVEGTVRCGTIAWKRRIVSAGCRRRRRRERGSC